MLRHLSRKFSVNSAVCECSENIEHVNQTLGVNLILDSSHEELKFVVFLSKSFLFVE